MNLKTICSFLGLVSMILGIAMLSCVPWGLPAFGAVEADAKGMTPMLLSAVVSFATGLIFWWFGRGADTRRLYLREAFAGVALCWFLSVVLGAIPYLFGDVKRGDVVDGVDVKVGFCDAIFESASGLTTTGGTIFVDVENPETLPRPILYWRGLTHFLGGLGVMCCFGAFFSQGGRGKAAMKVEHLFAGNLPFTQMKALTFSLFVIYVALCFLCALWLKVCGMTFFDSLYHSFSVIALGGFSSHNNSVAFYTQDSGLSGALIESGLIFFMIVAGTNYWLLYWTALRKPGKLFRDYEWRAFVISIFFATVLTTVIGLHRGDFVITSDRGADDVAQESVDGENASTGVKIAVEEVAVESEKSVSDKGLIADAKEKGNGEPATDATDEDVPEFRATLCRSRAEAFRKSFFHVTSLATGAGLGSENYERWNATTTILFLVLMFVGGCSASTAGGIKVFRAVLAIKVLAREVERRYRPAIVRATRIDGENVARETASVAIRYIFVFAALIVATTFVATIIEPDNLWTGRDRAQVEKLFDLGGGTLAMFANVGAAFGEFSCSNNYAGLTGLTKLIFSWAMIVGRLELWCVLAIFSPRFWRNR